MLICFVTALVYEILYQKVFSELDRKYTSSKGPKQNPASDVNNVMTNYYQNGLTEDDAFKEDSEDNSGWTEVVRGRSNKGAVYYKLYNNQINAHTLIGQSAVGYCAGKPTEKSCVF